MERNLLENCTLIAKKDDIVENVLYIVEGRIFAVRDDMTLILKKGDFVGIEDFSNGTHSFDYYATKDTKCRTFCSSQMVIQSNFFTAKQETARAIALSMNHYLRDSYVYLNSLCARSEEIHKFVLEYYNTYLNMCKELNLEGHPIGDIEELSESIAMSLNHKCVYQYHKGIYTLLADKELAADMNDRLLIPGYMFHASIDFNDVINSKDFVCSVIEEHNLVLINDNHDDLLSRFSELYSRLGEKHSLSPKLMECMINICTQAKETSVDIRNMRINELKNNSYDFEEGITSAGDGDSVTAILRNSMSQIIELVGYDEENAKDLKRVIREYKDVYDSNVADDEAKELRKSIEKHFYQLYLLALEVCVETNEIPIILKMFVLFGYLDEELAGISNACELYDLAQTYAGRPDQGLYTGFEWLLAIFIGDKNPSINEFEQDFEQFITEQVSAGKIPEEQKAAYLRSRAQMVMFELQNMFRGASRICSGHILDFCPVFSEHQILRSPKESILNPLDIIAERDNIRNIDYSIFYRSSMFVYDKKENIHDTIHVEILPDIVIMPVVGSRGSMWQEIVGRNRSTPARMMLPAFNNEKLDKVLLRIFAEFRWEICKREQGARWNDVTDPSLTSLYYDYLQFYRKNSKISVEQKEKIKIGLQRARNVYKEYFINDYSEYIRYEANGSPHLIRASRAILYFQCPFSAEIRRNLSENPIFKELNERLKIKYSQQLHKLDNIRKKMANRGQKIPVELENEIGYYRI